MSKTIIYLVLLALLGYAVYFFIFSERDVFGKDDSAFTIKDTAAIHKIYLADKTGHAVLLERKDNAWVLDGKYNARQATISTLLKTLAIQAPLYPVPETMHNNVVAMLSAKAIKVELYDEDGDLIRRFYMGGQTKAGTFMLMEGAERPYVVQIPGFDGYLTPRFNPAFDNWRDKLVCDIPEEQLKAVTVQYPEEPLNSFTVTRDKNGALNVLLDPELMKTLTLNKKRAEIYAKYFSKLYCEGYINGTTGLDSVIRNTAKRCAVDIEGWNGQKQHLDVYWMALTKRSKNRITPNPDAPMDYDADRFYGVMNNFKDTVIIQRQMFEKIFRKGYEFYQADDTTSVQPQNLPVDTRAGSIKMGGNR